MVNSKHFTSPPPIKTPLVVTPPLTKSPSPMTNVSASSSPPWNDPTDFHAVDHDLPQHEQDDDAFLPQQESNHLDSLSTTNHHIAPPFPTTVNPTPFIVHVSFNQDYGCFSIGTNQGFRIYNCDPFREIFRRDFDGRYGNGGGIGVVEMLFRCNVLALVGGGTDPQYPVNKVMIWDDHQSRCIGELSFRSEVKAVKLRRDRIVVVLEQKIFVYNFSDLKLLNQIETIANPKGLCAISQNASSLILVCPGLQKGQIRIEHYASKRTKFIMAHDSRIACFALSADGQLIATCSTKGTLVRIFSSVDGNILQEVRRGADRAEIYSLAFSPTADWLAVSSDKGTVHVFGLKAVTSSTASGTISDTTAPSKSSLSFIKGVLPKYFNSEWSVARFRLNEGFQYIVAFGHQKNTVVILGMDGSFYRCEFDPVNGGDMIQLEYQNFLNPEKDF